MSGLGRPTTKLVLLAVVASLLTGCTDPRQDIDLVGLLHVDESSGFHPYMEGGSDVTDSFCSQEIRCNQAIETPYFRMSRFAEREAAHEYANQSETEAYVSGWITIEFTDQASARDRRAIESGIDGLYTSDP